VSQLKDIAEKTGLSVSTVSRALHNSYEISEETKQAVVKAACQLGYRSKKNRPSKTIGLIIPDIQCNYYSEMVAQIQKEFEKKDYFLITAISGYFIFEIVSTIKKMVEQDICGIVITDCYRLQTDEEYAEHNKIANCPVPVLRISQNEYDLNVDTIKLDELYGTELLIDHLVSQGHCKIGYVGEFASDLRYGNFVKIMSERGLPVDERYVKRGKERAELGGYLRTLELIEEIKGNSDPVTAVIVCYDQVALGVLNAISENKLSVPKDLSLVSFDDMILNNYLTVPLTSISFPTEELCSLAVKTLLNNINDPSNHAIQTVVLQPNIVVRESVSSLETPE